MYFNHLSRRKFLKLGLGAMSGAGAIAAMQSGCTHSSRWADAQTRDFSVSNPSTHLKEIAATKNIDYGVAARLSQLQQDAAFLEKLVEEANLLVPEWEFKWTAGNTRLRPGPDQFDFTAADAIASLAQAHGLRLRGHALIWHESLPPWFEQHINAENAQQLLEQHITTVMSRYAGQMHSWDVVNEAIAYDPQRSKRADGLRDTSWLKYLGVEYLDLAFRTAASTDPQALLVYNDFGLDYDRPQDEAKRTAVLNLLKRLRQNQVPIDALGIQAHLQGHVQEFNPKVLQQFLRQVADLGLKIMITELDVNDQKLPASIESRDQIVASQYEDYLAVALAEPAVISVITWGLSDRYTYLSEFSPRKDGQPVRPLPLDQSLQPKLAWNAMVRAFERAPR